MAAVAVAVPLLVVVPAAAQAQPPPGIRVEKGIVFASPGGIDLHMNAFLPPGENQDRMGVLTVHGGGWAHGGLAAAGEQARYLAQQGFVAFTIEYRLAPENPYPAAVEDCLAAVRYIRDHAAQFGVDPKRIGALGGSAGGNLVALLATMGSGPPDTGSRIKAAVSWSGPMDLVDAAVNDPTGVVARVEEKYLGCSVEECADRYHQASPITYVDPTDAPMLMSNGTGERIPQGGVKEMADLYKRNGIPYRLVILPAPCHSDQCQHEPVPRTDQDLAEASAAFLQKWLNATHTPASPVPSPSPEPTPSPGPSGGGGGTGAAALIAAGVLVAAGVILLLVFRTRRRPAGATQGRG